ncbi:MAG: ABC transporter permease subunit [Deltaproteobacteria bacterium]|nr:ABC transporter permease subunit [Deltaproteobacteria bacterium]
MGPGAKTVKMKEQLAARAATKRPWARPQLLCLPLIVLFGALLVWPLALLVWESIATADGATLRRYADIVLIPRYRAALLWSLGISLAVAAVSTLTCLAPAWLFVRKEFAGKRLLRAAFALPMSFSGVIVGFLMIIMLGRAGFVPAMAEKFFGSAWLSGAAYQTTGLLLAYLYFEIPRATLTLESALRKFDVRLEAAAQSLGANRLQSLFWVILPTIWPALVSTFAVTFTVSLGSFGVALILSTRQVNLLPLEIFTNIFAVPSDRAMAAALSMMLTVVALGVNYGIRSWMEREAVAR